ncbi:MAG: LemA family protein, partial [Clostridia bacterium]
LALVAFAVLVWYVTTRNSIKRSELKIEEAESGIDVALTKRFDVLTKSLDITKGYADHEKQTLFSVINLRKGASLIEKSTASKQMDNAFEKINAIAEAYPELKSSENFKRLQDSVADVEEHLQAARRLYNGNVTTYNEKIVSFPSSFVAGRMGVVKKEYFQAEDLKTKDVEMKF